MSKVSMKHLLKEETEVELYYTKSGGDSGSGIWQNKPQTFNSTIKKDAWGKLYCQIGTDFEYLSEDSLTPAFDGDKRIENGYADTEKEFIVILHPTIYTTIGVYANHSYKVNGVSVEHIDSHIDYNITYRPGRALFVNGVCKHKGYLNDEEIAEFKVKLKDIVRIHDSRPYQ